MSARTPRVRAAGLVVALTLLTGCVGMPTEGPVEESQVAPDGGAPPGISYDPLPPQPGQSAPAVVSGFLEAMKATPISLSVARQFLTTEAQEAWAPEHRILTYAELDSPTGQMAVSVDLEDVNHYDERGAWVRTQGKHRIEFTLTTEDGEWRIDHAPDALVVPELWFGDWYQRVSLYYFDPAAQILVPEPVFAPEGEQFASSLVRGLLTAPAGPTTGVVRTFFPSGTAPGLSVPIETGGIADVALSGDPDTVDMETAERMMAQLAWTLRQDLRVNAVELRVGDRPFGTSTGLTQVKLDVGALYDPAGASATTDLFALQDGLLVSGTLGSLEPTLGPLGQQDVAATAFGVNLSGTTVAAVTGDGTSLLRAPVDQPDAVPVEVMGGVDLLAPAWDHRDRVWVVDRYGGRARVFVVDGDVITEVAVPGVTGRDVRELLVSRDGTRLVALRRGRKGADVVSARVLQDEAGTVLQVLPATRLDLPDDPSARIRDIAWRSPTTVSVLSVFPSDVSEVRTVSVDGAPGEIATEALTRLRGRASALVSSPLPVDTASVYAVTGPVVTDLTTPDRVLPQLPEGMTGLTYSG